MSPVGTWHIVEMEMWDEAYFNMVRQAYIEIGDNLLVHFQFGLVSGQIDGEVEEIGGEERFDFTWDGVDEMDPVAGSGWLKLTDGDSAEGQIRFHLGDKSRFWVTRAK